MGIGKRILQSDTGHRLICSLIANYVRFVRWTSRWDVSGTEERDRLWDEGRPFLIALWHNRIAMMPYAYAEKSHELCVVASGHRDGRIVPGVMGHFGFDGIPVDSKDGAKATRTIVKRLKAGDVIGFTPDGPRGPRLEMKEGLVTIAALAGVPIVPVAYSVKRRKVLGSWDRFVLPLPFTRGICRWGPAFELPKKPDAETREAFRQKLETAMNELTDACDIEMGHSPIDRPPRGSSGHGSAQ